MASLADILANTQEQIESQIEGITPNKRVEYGYRARDPDARHGTSPIDEQVNGAPRLFEVVYGEAPGKRIMDGAGTRVYEMTAEVVINYPNDNNWRMAAIDDGEAIHNHLLSNHLTISAAVTGLELAMGHSENEPVVEVSDKDPQFQTLRIPLWMMVKVS